MIFIEPFVDLDPDQVRFFSKVNLLTESGCWQWVRPLDNGYGRFQFKRKTTLAHRQVLAFTDPERLASAQQVDHLCRNRGCVRPDHLEMVTLKENALRGEGITAANLRVTHCSNRHEYDHENTYRTPSGSRDCIKCQRQRVRDWRARQKEMGK